MWHVDGKMIMFSGVIVRIEWLHSTRLTTTVPYPNSTFVLGGRDEWTRDPIIVLLLPELTANHSGTVHGKQKGRQDEERGRSRSSLQDLALRLCGEDSLHSIWFGSFKFDLGGLVLVSTFCRRSRCIKVQVGTVFHGHDHLMLSTRNMHEAKNRKWEVFTSSITSNGQH